MGKERMSDSASINNERFNALRKLVHELMIGYTIFLIAITIAMMIRFNDMQKQINELKMTQPTMSHSVTVTNATSNAITIQK